VLLKRYLGLMLLKINILFRYFVQFFLSLIVN